MVHEELSELRQWDLIDKCGTEMLHSSSPQRYPAFGGGRFGITMSENAGWLTTNCIVLLCIKDFSKVDISSK